jgi:hypothetical protein
MGDNMLTGLQLAILVPDEGVIGEATILIWRQDGKRMTESMHVFEGTAILPTLSESGDYYQWAVTCLRDIADRAVAQLLREMNQGTQKPMLIHQIDEISLRVGVRTASAGRQ